MTYAHSTSVECLPRQSFSPIYAIEPELISLHKAAQGSNAKSGLTPYGQKLSLQHQQTGTCSKDH